MPETGEQLITTSPERKPYAPQEGLRLIDDHINQTVKHPGYVAPWRPILLIRDKEGFRIPSYHWSMFVPDKTQLEEGLPAVFSRYGFNIAGQPAAEKKTSWGRHNTEFKPGFIWKDGILMPNVDSIPVSNPVSRLSPDTNNQVTDLQANMRAYGGTEKGLFLTRTVYEDGETVFDRQGRITKEVGRQEIYRIHRAEVPGSIPPQSPLGLRWVQVPHRSL